LRPLFFGFFITMLFGLGATTPAAPVLLGTVLKALTGRNAFEVLTFERFTFWATLMAMPIVVSWQKGSSNASSAREPQCFGYLRS